MRKIPRKNLKLMVYDFDGVMTDNRVLVMQDGKEGVVVNRADGLAVGIIKKWGIPQMIISTETNKVVQVRAKKLGIPVIQGTSDKRKSLSQYCIKHKIDLDQVLYIGNDLNDLEVMEIVKYALCPSDAVNEVKDMAFLVLETPGGAGVVRELINCIQ